MTRQEIRDEQARLLQESRKILDEIKPLNNWKAIFLPSRLAKVGVLLDKCHAIQDRVEELDKEYKVAQ